jgi:paraquat-inducible protein B
VEFRGIPIGQVREVRLELDPTGEATRIPVLVDIEPERLGLDAIAAPAAERQLWERLVQGGLRAQLKTGNLLTGALYVDLDFYRDTPAQDIAWDARPPSLPTVPTPLDELRTLLTRLSRLPLDRMGEDLSSSVSALRDTLEQTRAVLQRLDGETAPELTRTLVQTRKTLESAEQVLTPGSPLQSQAQRVLHELGAAARSLRIMADYLERHPEALIRGKAAQP